MLVVIPTGQCLYECLQVVKQVAKLILDEMDETSCMACYCMLTAC